MHITQKAAKRRGKDFRYLKGSVIDIGCGGSPIEKLYDGITEFRGWDMPDGDAQYMVGCKNYDCVHSSHSLEHMVDPIMSLKRWAEIANKYLVIVVPDEEMYEKGIWPSIHNSDHKFSFTTRNRKYHDFSINVFDMIRQIPDVDVIKVERLEEDYDPNVFGDQTPLGTECAIEIILRKI